MNTRGLAALAATVVLSLTSLARADEPWTTDLEAAKATAAKEGKDLLIDFTGSDWCVWCIRLEQEVFSTEVFKTGVTKDFVLVRLDFPDDQSRISPEQLASNEALRSRWRIEGFPTIVLADAAGRPFATEGYEKGGPENYLALLAKDKATRVARDAAFAAVEGKEGVERAKALDGALSAMKAEVSRQFYGAEITEIAKLAKDDSELGPKYAEMANELQLEMLDAAVMEHAAKDDWAGALAAIDATIAENAADAKFVREARKRKIEVALNTTAGVSDWDGAFAAIDGFAKEYADDPELVTKCAEMRSRVNIARMDATIGPHVEASDWDAALKALDEFATANAQDALAVREARMRKVDVVMNQHGMKDDWDKVIETMHALSVDYADDPMPKQKALTNESYGYHEKGDLAKCVELLEAAAAADPDGPMAEQVKAIIEQVKREQEAPKPATGEKSEGG